MKTFPNSKSNIFKAARSEIFNYESKYRKLNSIESLKKQWFRIEQMYIV